MVAALNAERELYQEVAAFKLPPSLANAFAFTRTAGMPGLVDNLAEARRGGRVFPWFSRL